MVTEESEYQIYHQMKQRCDNPNHLKYNVYGGRGITVCNRWLGENGYKHFIEDMGYKPNPDMSIDRIDVDGNYEPSNCRWATIKEQSMNKQNSVKIIPREKNNSLTVKEEVFPDITDKKFRRFVLCVCDCGNEKIVRYDKFKSGRTKTCGNKNCKHNGPLTK